MAIAAALFGFNDLGSPGDPFFSFQKQILFTVNYTLYKSEQKNQCEKLKKFQDFCPRNVKSCHLAAARRVKLWSLNANLFFEEPHQLERVMTSAACLF